MLSVLYGLLGKTIYSAGVILQKKGIGWMRWNGNKNIGYMFTLGIWLCGIVLSYVVSALPTAAASMELPPHVISSLTGWSIIIALFLSKSFLRERLNKSDVFYSCVIVACIIIVNIFSELNSNTGLNTGSLYYLMLIPLILLVPVAVKAVKTKYKIMLLSIFSGIMSGLTLVLMNVLVKESTGSLMGIIASPYVYIYFFTGIISGLALQMGLKMGDVIVVMPLQTSMIIVYPVVCTYFLFGSGINLLQLAAILLIVFSCIKILGKR